MTVTPSWLTISPRIRTVPRSGRRSDGVVSSTVSRPASVSPGRTGASQRSSSIPGEPCADAQPSMRVDVEAHPHRAGVPAARDQAAEDGLLRGLGVDVERLRVELPREVDDLVLGDGAAAELEHLAGLEVLEVRSGMGAAYGYRARR